MMKDLILILAVTFLQIGVSFSHVALTYPLPRRVNYDFLDNVRTDEPCGGQAKGEPLSEFREGDNITVTWHLGYPHKGGYKIELLGLNDSVTTAQQLLPTGNLSAFTGSDDTTSTSAVVKLPLGFTCDNCTLRFMRQALEWGDDYLFWSCADIKIIDTVSTFCSNKGNYRNGRCECEKLYYGDRCQYWDECELDTDCSNGGKCYDTHAVSSPRKQCFCAPGFFGEGCEKASSVKTLNNLDLSKHRKNTMSDKFVLYSQVSGEEIEMVIKAKTNTWVGIGWKPTGSLSCKHIDGPTPESESTAEPEGTSEPENTPEPESKSTPEPETTAEHSAKTNESESTAEPEGTSEPGDYSKTGAINITSDIDYISSQGLDPSLVNYQCTPGYGGKSEPEPEATAEKGSSPEPKTEPESESKAEPESESEAEPESESAGAHPMDCTDMVIMAAKGNYSRIHDAFSRDRSTPKFDTYFGAGNSLTAAIGEEIDGETTILFRRKLKAADNRDHEIADALMNVIWAYGQEHLNYNHAPKTGLEFCTVKDIFFYRNDVLMYHGHQGKRGASSINFLTAPEPESNQFSLDAETYVTWKEDSKLGTVTFTLNAKLPIGGWVALGISADKEMAVTDVFHVGIDSQGKAIPTDRFATGYSLPALDQDESEEISASWTDGVVQATIIRKVGTETASDDISLDQCRHLIIGTGSGFNADGGRFNRHATTPVISEEKMCFETAAGSDSDSGSPMNRYNPVMLAVLVKALYLLLN